MNTTSPMRVFLASVLLLSSALAHAGTQLGATRIVLAAPASEASIPVKNTATSDVMIQSWIEAGENDTSDVPLAVTPALSRLGGSKQQMLRIFYQGQGLPTDRESVFWLSVQEIPQKAEEENTLQIAVRQRIKLFYRPAGLSGTPDAAAAALNWQLVERDGRPQLQVSNPSAYHVSLAGASLREGGRDYAVETDMVMPGATQLFALKDAQARPSANATVAYQVVNDYGGQTSLTGALKR